MCYCLSSTCSFYVRFFVCVLLVLLFVLLLFLFFFFFKQKTAYEMRISDWSSDVCSSDLCADSGARMVHGGPLGLRALRRGHESRRQAGDVRSHAGGAEVAAARQHPARSSCGR